MAKKKKAKETAPKLPKLMFFVSHEEDFELAIQAVEGGQFYEERIDAESSIDLDNDLDNDEDIIYIHSITPYAVHKYKRVANYEYELDEVT